METSHGLIKYLISCPQSQRIASCACVYLLGDGRGGGLTKGSPGNSGSAQAGYGPSSDVLDAVGIHAYLKITGDRL